jgi:magnesium-transporting ATPase (P-type)
MSAVEDADAKLRESSAKGIGGWLILLGFTLVVSGVLQFYNLGTGIREVARVQASVSSATMTYLYVLLLVDVAIVVAWLYVIYLFFGRRENFRKWFVGVVLLNLIAQIAVLVISTSIFNAKPSPSDYRDIGRMIVYCLIWFSYVAASRRVRYTFVH